MNGPMHILAQLYQYEEGFYDMRTRYEAMMDGIALSSIDPSVYVTDISEEEPKIRRAGAAYALGDGLRTGRVLRESLTVRVAFEIHEKDVRRRGEICQRIQRWAQGKALSVNYRPGQRLLTVCETQPSVASALRWTQTLEAVFTAYAVPYWEDEIATRISITGNGSASVFIPGTAEYTLVEAVLTNAGSTDITSARLSVDGMNGVAGTAFAFTGICIPPDGALKIAYDDARVLSASVGGKSVLAQRTAESDDDLLSPCGKRVTFTVEGTGAGARTSFSVRGRYL